MGPKLWQALMERLICGSEDSESEILRLMFSIIQGIGK